MSILKGADDGWESRLDGVGVDGLDDGDRGLLGEILHRSHLVGDGHEGRAEQREEIGLHGGRDCGVVGDGGDGIEGLFAGGDIFFVGELFLE